MKISIDTKAYDRAIKQVREYAKLLETKERDLLKRLAQYGATRVEVLFARVQYDGDDSITVTFNAEQKKATIIANGKSVAFIEFGAGVYFNDAESYPLPRPQGIVGIGQYGKGKGNNPNGWYYTSNGESRFTKGNPPAMAMYRTIIELGDEVTKIAREVFKS